MNEGHGEDYYGHSGYYEEHSAYGSSVQPSFYSPYPSGGQGASNQYGGGAYGVYPDYHHHHPSVNNSSSSYAEPYNGYTPEDSSQGGWNSPEEYYAEGGVPPGVRSSSDGSPENSHLVKRKATPLFGPGSNKKERRRTQSINNAFASLRDCIPNVPCDTKLSKIKTLRLATSYIDYLINLLNSENSDQILLEGFKVDIHKKWNEKTEEQKRRELEEELTNGGTASRGSNKLPKGGGNPGRTGWPQHVWALELK